MPKTMFEKIWEAHTVRDVPGESAILYIDRHLVHEMTSPQAFAGLRTAHLPVRHPEATIAVLDHNVPTVVGRKMINIVDAGSTEVITTMEQNARDFGLTLFDMGDARQGIVHIIGPEQGITLPGMTIVCGDSHTSTHGAMGALAFGIGTSEVELVLATQCLLQKRPKTMNIRVEGTLAPGVTAKDLALAIIGKLGTGVGNGHVIEFSGSTIRSLSMEGRMTLCNMAIEAGAQFDAVHEIRAEGLGPQITWGTNPGMVVDVNGYVPDPASESDPEKRHAYERALKYMDLKPGQKITEIPLNTVFIGSCTNSRLEDLRMAAQYVKGKHIAPNIRAMVVPGSMRVRRIAEEEGLADIFREAGFEWREAGCSMCIAMNGDQLSEGERCASTSNRNFEGRQGRGGRTHLVSPAMAAAAAIAGHFVDIRTLEPARELVHG